MSVQIEVRGNIDTPEYKAARHLEEIFRKGLNKSNASGKVVILAGATLFGQSTKDVDIILYGNIERLKQKLQFLNENGERTTGEVYINNFCACIETKRHAARDIVLDGLVLKVRYNGKLHDATNQSEKQKYALKNFIKERTGREAPYIYNFIWLTEVSQESLLGLVGGNDNSLSRHNFLPSDISLSSFFQLIAVQKTPFKVPNKEYYVCNSVGRSANIDDYDICSALDFFTEIRQAVGEMTRKKIENISRRIIKEQNYAAGIGKELVVIAGRAGTGKTMKLLRLAYDLAINQGKRCLILTYNLLLVSDIRRLLALSRMPDDVDSYSVNIQTLHKFFYELAIGFGICQESRAGKKYISDFIEKYDEYLAEIMEYIEAGVINDKDIQDIMETRQDEVAWDILFIDEAQDWRFEERDLIYRIFGYSKVIIADGVDQMVRSQVHCNWTQNVPHQRTHERRCLRQKRNLVHFINAYAEEFNLGWELEPLKEYEGGKIIISKSQTPFEIFKREYESCCLSGNRAYEMMFLTPPSLVRHDGPPDKYGKPTSFFRLTEEFAANGFLLWDGTCKDLRSDYPTDVNQHRILQYDSCRGLEAWTVACLGLDDFIQHKMKTYDNEKDENKTLFQEDEEERKERFVYLWSLIPLTRAIDTVVITLRDSRSAYGERLRGLAERMSDFVEWVE